MSRDIEALDTGAFDTEARFPRNGSGGNFGQVLPGAGLSLRPRLPVGFR